MPWTKAASSSDCGCNSDGSSAMGVWLRRALISNRRLRGVVACGRRSWWYQCRSNGLAVSCVSSRPQGEPALAPPFPPPRPHKAAYAEVAEERQHRHCAQQLPVVCRVRMPLAAQTPRSTAANSTRGRRRRPQPPATTPQRRTNVFHAVSPKRLPPRRSPCLVPRALMTVWAAAWAALLAVLPTAGGGVVLAAAGGKSAAGRIFSLAAACPAFTPVPALLAEGFFAVAASTAAVTVFTACRAPKPSAHVQSELNPYSKCRAISRECGLWQMVQGGFRSTPATRTCRGGLRLRGNHASVLCSGCRYCVTARASRPRSAKACAPAR